VTGDIDPLVAADRELLWRMKRSTHREKDAGEVVFLHCWFAGHGQVPPE
jgi:hypothetical protein